jgi:hypothetical protein
LFFPVFKLVLSSFHSESFQFLCWFSPVFILVLSSFHSGSYNFLSLLVLSQVHEVNAHQERKCNQSIFFLK